ncbi:hypothetical protein K435DRAFT_871314 [Dendrothele bispora CBS 962.96]|uniref:CxC2-like cysteine cluster KDZ transposase-associated domain-containing protein n=1 Tax=Dendrothele bispora (strain CBS 962.96) TaxID=1314807 RepID=A0A4S8L4B2_DENBC|nr:hypothetical protein K435DRAFT_871314 [Dendrothele bispora CBS 962.96]
MMRPAKRFRTSRGNALSDVHSLHSLGLSVHQPEDSVIQHSSLSKDGRRIRRHISSSAPIRERLYTEIEPCDDWSGFPDEYPQPEVLEGPTEGRFIFQVKKGRVTRVLKRKFFRSDRPMKVFLENREGYLAIQMILKGRGDHIPDHCTLCPSDREATEPTFRCVDCTNAPLMCQDCCVENHRLNPLHRIEHWTGRYFEKISLRRLGLVIQLGHQNGSECPFPVSGPSKFIIVHNNGIHRVRMSYCGCEASLSSQTGSMHHKWEQLMRNRLFPATHTRPSTAYTFQMLSLFHALTLSGKVTAYDFYKGLERTTNNTGAKLPNRYPSMLRVSRQWRHLRMLRRGGRGNDGERTIDETKPGELAVECIACPRPEINLPSNWTNAPDNIT